MIRLIDATKNYKRTQGALRGVSLTVRDGEFVFVTGPSGSGKSTFLKLLTGEEKPSSGRVLVNGYDMGLVRQWQLPYVRRTLGIIFQDYRLIENRTVRENLTLAAFAVNQSYAGLEDRVAYVADLTGLSERLDEQVVTLSGGEKQRAGIARAMINNPQAILADEPTGNLDPEQSVAIMDLLERVNRLGITMIVITHDQEAVKSRPDMRSVCILHGSVAHDGTGYYMDRWGEYKLRKLHSERAE